jgi:ATP-dependent RNA helicase DOB1
MPACPSLPPLLLLRASPPEGLVTAKGRVAAELSVGHDELVLTELLLGGAFADTPPDVMAALCSCLVWSERSVVPPR